VGLAALMRSASLRFALFNLEPPKPSVGEAEHDVFESDFFDSHERALRPIPVVFPDGVYRRSFGLV